MRGVRTIFGLVAVVFLAAFSVLPVLAADYGGGNVQGYTADKPLNSGTIVRLSEDDNQKQLVTTASQKDKQKMFGVVVDRQQLTIAITNETLENEVYVADSGTYDVLVSTQGGAIESGDYVMLSSIDGVAMKAGTDEGTVFGRAGASFDGKGVTLGTTTLKDLNTGKDTQTVQIGQIPVTIDIRNNPNIKSTEVNAPDILKRIGQAIAEKEVSPIRMYLSVAIAVVSLIAAIAVLYAGVRTSFISIGRNPMSKKSIYRALAQVIISSVLILIIGLFAVYLLLKL